MFKLVVLSALLALAAAKPYDLEYSAQVLPGAVSHQSRTDYISKPLVAATYSAPASVAVVESAPVAAYSVPETVVVESAPAVASVAVPAAVSHQSRTDYISKPVVATYAAYTHDVINKPVVAAYASPVVAQTVVKSVPVAYATVPAAVSHQSRTDYISEPVVASYAAHTTYEHLW